MIRRLAVAISLLVVASACRPALGPSPTPTPSSIVADLVPKSAMTVAIRLPGSAGAMFAPFAAISQLGLLAANKVTVSAIPLGSPDGAFTPSGRTDVVDLYALDTATALRAREQGADLVYVASLEHLTSWGVVSRTRTSLNSLAGSNIYVDGFPGDEHALRATLQGAGINTGDIVLTYSTDTAVPFDPAMLADGTFDAVYTRSSDGLPRILQSADENGVAYGADSFTWLPMTGGRAGGLGLWASAASIASEDGQIAAAAALVALAATTAGCRDDLQGCSARYLEAGLSEFDEGTIAWALNQWNGSLWPSAGPGLFAIDEAAVEATGWDAQAAGIVISLDPVSAYVDQAIYALASAHWPPDIDLVGSDWVPEEVPLPQY